MHTCIYSRASFATASAEHILQNFLGARWADDTIVSDPVQAQFSTTIDAALERGLRPIRNVLGTLSGRRNAGPIVRHTLAKTGEAIDLKPGGEPSLAQPKVEVAPHSSGEGQSVEIQVRNKEQLDWAIAQLREKLPGKISDDLANQIKAHAISKRGRIDEAIHVRVKFGGPEYLRGVAKSCFNLLATQTDVLNSAFDQVREFILNGKGDSGDFARWPALSEPLTVPTIGPFDQFVGIVNRGSIVEGLVQLFGGVLHSIRLTDSYSGSQIACGYLVDPTRAATPAEIRNPDFDAACVPDFSAQPAKPNEGAWATMQQNVGGILKRYYDREREPAAEKIIKEVLEPNLGKPMKSTQLTEIAKRIADLVAGMI